MPPKWAVCFLVKNVRQLKKLHEPLGTNQAGYDETARLLHDIGTTTITSGGTHQFTSYANPNNDGSGGSGSDPDEIPIVFHQFGYTYVNNTASVADQELSGADNGAAYASLLSSEIQTYQRPSILSAYPSKGTVAGLVYWPQGTGHTWVCDGSNQWITSDMYTYNYYDPSSNALIYSTVAYTQPYPISSLLHMNWGLSVAVINAGGPNNDGWYDASTNYTNNPNGTNYWYFQTVTYNIHPN